MSDFISFLFKTNALNICPENSPFWYTSGKIGPYYINAEFLYGSKQDSKDLLEFINQEKENELELPIKLFKKIEKQYTENEIYRYVINEMKNKIEQNIDVNEIDYVSGGERRDWFFSNVIAHLLNKPHISIYKDLSTVVSDCNFENTEKVTDLSGKKVLHVADLITIASSYIRAWIPAIKNLNAKICWSCVVVDRMQGGQEKLANEGVKSLSLVNIDKDLFKKALDMNIINESQFDMLNKFFENPDDTMKQFLINHPEFLENALNSDEKTKGRAKLLIDGNLYGIN